MQKGKKFTKAPLDTSCQQCIKVRRKVCELPASADCRKKIEKVAKKKTSMVPSMSSGGKRQQVKVEIKLPVRKKTRQAAEEDDEDTEERMMEGRFREAWWGLWRGWR